MQRSDKPLVNLRKFMSSQRPVVARPVVAPAAAPAAAPAQLGGRKQKTRKLKYKQGKRVKKCKKMKSRRL